MFESFGNSIVKGIMTFTLLLLSSYEGNDAILRSFDVNSHDNSIVVETRLDNAFENDFQEVFKTGQKLSVMFTINVESDGTVIQSEEFSHDVTYIPLEDSYLLEKTESNETIICSNYTELVENLSKVKWQFRKLSSINKYVITLESYLEKVYFEQMNKEFNLMLLWKNKRPRVRETIEVNLVR